MQPSRGRAFQAELRKDPVAELCLQEASVAGEGESARRDLRVKSGVGVRQISQDLSDHHPSATTLSAAKYTSTSQKDGELRRVLSTLT